MREGGNQTEILMPIIIMHSESELTSVLMVAGPGEHHYWRTLFLQYQRIRVTKIQKHPLNGICLNRSKVFRLISDVLDVIQK